VALIAGLPDRSIEARSRAVEVPDLEGEGRVPAGARRYATLCVSCHLAPGMTTSDLRRRLYPHPPNLSQENPPDARRAFWSVKHGIKMSAMPAWGQTVDDAAIWDVVAFVRSMPRLTPQAYERLSQ
jgi:mono/diheme cytochrome c family protein